MAIFFLILKNHFVGFSSLFFVAKWRKFVTKKTLVRSSFQARFKWKKKKFIGGGAT
jgi:hypothetical protein